MGGDKESFNYSPDSGVILRQFNSLLIAPDINSNDRWGSLAHYFTKFKSPVKVVKIHSIVMKYHFCNVLSFGFR